MTSSYDLNLDLEKIYLDIEPALQEQAWQRAQALANPTSRWRAYLNELALRSLAAWLEESPETASAKPMLRKALWPTVWEWVEGSSCEVGALRWVIMPSESIDDDELRVPQEWVDIPDWVGDYYLLLQVNPEDGWVKIAGYATHAALKEQGEYDSRDRTYSLPSSKLSTEINAIELTQAIAPEAIKRVAVSPVPELPLAQANQLMQRLSDPAQLNPRLAIGFGPWSALLSHGGWRAEMTRQRQGSPPARSVKQWLQEGLSQRIRQLGWQSMMYQPVTAGARGEDGEMAQSALSKEIAIAGERYRIQISEIAGEQPNAWRFELRKQNGLIPPGITLRLLTEDLQPFENNAVTSVEPVEQLYVDVALADGEGLVWTTEPASEAYEAEILRF